jgi:hypothetical protein
MIVRWRSSLVFISQKTESEQNDHPHENASIGRQ